MTSEEVRHLLKQKPFQPFRIHVNDGRSFEIRHPWNNMVVGETLCVGVEVSEEPDPIPEYLTYVHIPFIRQVDLLPAPAAAR
jgi:hypothetical protein